jgi:hypothetical protein
MYEKKLYVIGDRKGEREWVDVYDIYIYIYIYNTKSIEIIY